MTEIEDEPDAYVVRRNGEVIAATVPTESGEWLGGALGRYGFSTLRRPTREQAVTAIRQKIGYDA